jgi:phosphoribosylformylglycinamidine synthase
LNFGNPYNPEAFYQFSNAVTGMGEACRAFGTPVTGGNVSFYNQSVYEDGRTEPVYPTPTIGMLGLLDHHKRQTTIPFVEDGDVIYLIGESKDDLGSSEYLRRVHAVEYSPAPHFELEEELKVQNTIKSLIDNELLKSAHDVSDGGLFVTLLESAMAGGEGFRLDLDPSFRPDAFLLGEAQSRVVVSVAPGQSAELEKLVRHHGVTFRVLGHVGGDHVYVDGQDWGAIDVWKERYDNVLGELLDN